MKILIKEVNSEGHLVDLYRGDEIQTRSYDPRLKEIRKEIILDLKDFKSAQKIVVVIER